VFIIVLQLKDLISNNMKIPKSSKNILAKVCVINFICQNKKHDDLLFY